MKNCKISQSRAFIFSFLPHFRYYCAIVSFLLCNSTEKWGRKQKMNAPGPNFYLPYFSAHPVQISAQKLFSRRRRSGKTCFLKNAFLLKTAIFSENQSKFHPIWWKFPFFVFFYHSPNNPYCSSDFQPQWAIIGKKGPKKHKN